jgi:hypothetical protein
MYQLKRKINNRRKAYINFYNYKKISKKKEKRKAKILQQNICLAVDS